MLQVWRPRSRCLCLFGKRAWREGISATLFSWQSVSEVLPSAVVRVDGVQRLVLVDTGCSRSIAYVLCCKAWEEGGVSMVTISSEEWKCEGKGLVCLQVSSGPSANISVSVVASKPLGFTFILGMDGIKELGGVTVDAQDILSFGGVEKMICAATDTVVGINERDFSATSDPSTKSWTVAWKWAEGREPDVLYNQVKTYTVPDGVRGLYKEELERWIFHMTKLNMGPAKGLIPLMAVIQLNKKKVRPLMDFRELNTHICAYTADADVCADKLWEWRKQGENVSVIDLAKAYLQIKIDNFLWPYQTVKFKGQRYCLT
ncbi:uncharacterized protein LOC123504848 [Portunus trituberculatus]|uniref:Reverse transcriptase domain-containing protein n=1 Tax=Portunus trituberculatus TaxID=210409 RepID=A0A5B7GEI0_PORTR|nr:uncharacterized protein LOC123504848 [Portunus trituberculatus]XP_045111681.1 uncharacterized protein LOC123504848 [Portunus trituberculatus]XP_045111682.1 uncharacterized protein LOC123504848 [Portunus trituberculatus]MPC58730.1 hypothetical protein [Portunus trituberculatus]